MPDISEIADQFAAAMKTIRPYAGDLGLGFGAAFLARQVPLWAGGDPTSTVWAAVAGGAVCLASYSLDWYDPQATSDPS